MFEDIDGTLRLIHQLCAPSTRIVISYYSHLWEPVLKTRRSAGAAAQAADQINYIATADFLNLMDLADFEVISQRAAAIAAAAAVRARPVRQPIHRAAAGHPVAVPAHLSGRTAGAAVSGPETLREHPHSLPQRARQHRERDPAHAALRQRAGNPVRRGQFQRRHLRGMRARPRRLQGRLGHQGPEAGRQGQGRCGPQGLCRGDRRRADDPRRRSDHAAGSAAEISRGDRERQGRIRQRHAPGLSDGKRGDAPAQPHRQPLLRLSVQLSRQYRA